MVDAAATAPPVPWTLRAAALVVSVETLVECIAVGGRASLTPGLRAGLVLCLALKWLFAWRALRLGAGGALGLLLLQATTAVAALGAVEVATPARLALGAVAVTTIGLLSASLHAFPAPTLPRA